MRRATAPIVSLLFVVGCAEAAVTTTCVDDGACPGDSVCAFGLCVDPGALGGVDVEVEPVVGSGLPVQAVFGVDIDGESRVDITLAEAVNVVGGVVASEGGGVAATVTAVPERAIAGRLRQVTTTTTDGPFSLPLVDGVAYRLQAVPTERALPPIFGDDVFVAGAGAPPGLEMTSSRDGSVIVHPVTVRGQVVAGVGVAAQPISELEVFLLDDTGRRVSSLGVTDVDGRFELGLAERYPDLRFVARRSERNAVSPTLAFPIDLGVADLIDIGVVSLGSSLGIVRVEGEVRTFSGAPADGAVVVFRGLVGAGVAEARTEAVDGRFSLSLHPGSYSVAAVGQGGGPGGMIVTTIDVEQDLRDVVLTLPERIPAIIDLVADNGAAVSLASVILARVGDDNGLAEPVLREAQPVFSASSDAAGHVELLVDPGRYRISVQPPRGLGVPTYSTLITVAEPLERTISLPPSTVLPGALRDGSGAGVAGAFVRVYSSLTDELGRAIFLGEALANPDGTFEVVVPLQ